MRSGPSSATDPSDRLGSPYGDPTYTTLCSSAPSTAGPTRTTVRFGIERVAEQPEHRRPLLEELEQPLAGVELRAARLAQQPGGAADVQLRAGVVQDLGEGGSQHREERPLAQRQRRVLEAAPQ